jgi:hypothetical protein
MLTSTRFSKMRIRHSAALRGPAAIVCNNHRFKQTRIVAQHDSAAAMEIGLMILGAAAMQAKLNGKSF